MTLHEACNSFLYHCHSAVNLSGHTYRAYQTDLKDFQNHARPETELTEVDKERLRQFIRHLREERKLKETTIKRRVACLKVFFRWAKEDGMVNTNPFENLHERIRLPKRLPRALSSGELALLSGAIRPAMALKASQELAIKVAVYLLMTTGIRVGELVGIDIDDLELDDNCVKIHGKGNRQRLVYIFDQTLQRALGKYLSYRRRLSTDTQRLLVNDSGMPYTTQKIRKHLSEIARHAGIERRITPHMLRHTTATQLLEAGVDIRYVQKLLGHQSISTTEIYTHVTDQGLRSALRRAYGGG